MTPSVQLEPEAQAFVEAAPKLFDFSPKGGRAAFNQLQPGGVSALLVEVEDRVIQGSPSGQVAVRIIRPPSAPAALPVLVYLHGGGWVSGGVQTHDRLVRELALGVEAAVVFPVYSLSPEAKYPTAIEECYAVVDWVAEQGAQHGLDPERIAVIGDGVGGNMAAAVGLMAKERGGPPIQRQALFYPVTDAAFETDSYRQFAEGYGLRRDLMRWAWDQYTINVYERAEITAAPLRASIEQLTGLPPALIITSEADVLRDEGEAYARKLIAAGVRVTAVRFQATIHGFLTLDTLATSAAARGAVTLAAGWLRDGFRGIETIPAP
ncbi:MAG TPA: alpha/beta hydrolase [Phototrophicaceae bacterium]|nr:alpha/beta hydrolase [Phototrophicaceae bacterium]